MKIAGPVSLSVFPSISVKAEQVSLSNTPWASNSEMLTVKQVELDIRMWPLLKGDVEISRVALTGVDANLQTNKAGVGNWNLTPPVLSQNNSSGQSAATSDSAADSPFIALKVVDLIDARINYQDGNQAPKIIHIPKLSLGSSEGKATILMDVQYAKYSLNLKGKTSSIRNAYFAWNQSPVKMDLDLVLTLNGKTLAITGDIDKGPQALPQFNVSLSSKSFDLAPLLGSAVVAGSSTKSSPKPSGENQGKYFFSTAALPFDVLPVANGSINVNISELGVLGQAPFKDFKTTLQFKKNSIDANDLSFSVGKGSALAQISIAGFDGAAPKISFKGLAKDFSLEQIISSADSGAKVSGGATRVAWNIQGSGVSPHQLVSHATGAIQLSVGQGRLDSSLIDKGGDFLVTLVDTINPLYKKSSQTILECAVAYLPVNNGVLTIQDSVGVETDRLDITLSGSVNLESEALNISINPREKSGLTTGVDLGGLVKIEGTIQNPKTGVNKTGVVTSAVSIGLGIITGGATILAENAKSMATKSQPCKTALHSWSDIYSVGK